MHRIDLHRHLWPDELVRVLHARSEPPFLRGDVLATTEGVFRVDLDALGPDACLSQLDACGVDVAVVSLQPTLGVESLPRAEADELHDAYNEGVARVVARSDERIRAFAA